MLKSEIKQQFEKFFTYIVSWNGSTKKGEQLLKQFSTDIASLSDSKNIRQNQDDKPTQFNALYAEQRFQSLQVIKRELKEIVASMQQTFQDAQYIVNHNTNLESFTQILEGEALSALDYFEFIQTLLPMYKQEYATKYQIVKSLNFDVPSDTLQTYQIIWSVQPHIDEDMIAEIKKKLEIDQSTLIKG